MFINSRAVPTPGYKSHTLNRVGWTGGGIKIFQLEYIITEVSSQISAVKVSYESNLLKQLHPRRLDVYRRYLSPSE